MPAPAPSPYDSSGLQFAFDASTLKAYEKCFTYGDLKYNQGWQRPGGSVHLWFGGLYASSLERFHKLCATGASKDDALASVVRWLLIESWDHDRDASGARIPSTGKARSFPLANSYKDRNTLIRTVIWYVDEFKDDPFTTLIRADGTPAVEASFRLPVDDGLVLSGHIDRLANDREGNIFSTDQKTTGQTISPSYFKQFKPDTQFCQPKGTLIRTRTGEMPIEEVTVGQMVMSYHSDTPTFRTQRVLGTVTRPYIGQTIKIKTAQFTHYVTPAHRVLMRYKDSFRDKFGVYLMRRNNQFRIGSVQFASTVGNKMDGLSNRCRNEKADSIWLLQITNSKKEAWYLEQFYSTEYSIPQVRFVSKTDDQSWLDYFWSGIEGNSARAANVLKKFGLDIDYPIYSVADSNSFASQRVQIVRACNLFNGTVQVCVYDNGVPVWTEAEITRESFSGEVVSLEIEKVGKSNYGGVYVANNIVTGNSLYTFAGKAIYNLPVKGIIVDAVQIAVGFSRFARSPVLFTEPELNEWYDETMRLMHRIREANREQVFPHNRMACHEFGGCEFREVCSRTPSVRANFLSGDFERREKKWNPLETR